MKGGSACAAVMLMAMAAGAARPPEPAASPSPVAPSPKPTTAPVEAAEPAIVRPELVRLLEAARRGELGVVKRLVEGGEAVNLPAGWRTPLIAASLHGHVPVIEYLLSKGADVNARDRQGRSALWAAVWSNQRQAFDVLLAKGADVNVANAAGDPLLFLAVERGQVEMARALIEKGAQVDRPSRSVLWKGYTPLHRAATLRDAKMIAMLLDKGADARLKNEKGQTAADLADGPGADEIRALLEAAKP